MSNYLSDYFPKEAAKYEVWTRPPELKTFNYKPIEKPSFEKKIKEAEEEVSKEDFEKEFKKHQNELHPPEKKEKYGKAARVRYIITYLDGTQSKKMTCVDLKKQKRKDIAVVFVIKFKNREPST